MTLTFPESQVALMQEAIEHWGIPAQVDQCVEECAELILALHKHEKRTRRTDTRAAVLDEMADVEMMLAQMRLCYGISDAELEERVAVKFGKMEGYLRGEV
ncbi:MAG: hypothetical protein LBR73_02080 [Oscillospiraceae bacterium]|jgi:hypothetical protein|nr:hypothetical protein [Oscillospiraceae bacterium]